MRATAMFLVLCLCGTAAVGCGKSSMREAANRSGSGDKKAKDGALQGALGSDSIDDGGPSFGPTAKDKWSKKEMAAAKDLLRETAGSKSGEKPMAKDGVAKSIPKESIPTAPPALADAVVGVEKATVARAVKQTSAQFGILTAGSFDDNVDPLVFSSFARRMGQDQALGGLPGKLQGRRLTVIVKDKAGQPVGDARVRLASGASAVELATRSDGRAVFVLSWDQLAADRALAATVTPPDGSAAVTDTIAAGSSRWEIALPATTARLPRQLDLAIVLDTTGSMGDELEYLKTELRGIVEAVQKKFPDVQKRFALVLYRDDGDEYVARRFDFTDSLAEFEKNLAAQSASGGGDYPEAMHRGLEEANQLRWREKDTARVVFLIADAPPHSQHMGRTLAAVSNLRKKGIAIYPVACSGYDRACEFVMRSCAMLTGSQFLFLTDDSGVGDSHAEPTIPYYQVERLERLMVRMILSELSGQHVPAQPSDILRTVGKKVN